MKKTPNHLGIIMDGNGRWAESRGKNRFWGHLKGAEVTQEIVEYCAKNTDIKFLSLYAFSTENWARPKEEVSFLFKLLDQHLTKKKNQLIENNIKVRIVGDTTPLPHNLKNRLDDLVETTSKNNGLNLSLAINYGGRDDIVQAVNQFMKNNPSQEIKEENIFQNLYTNELPDLDLVIRTSGEQRISNFMIWHTAYSELYFTEKHWPDFTAQDLNLALNDYSQRDRRFGKIKNNLKEAEA